jgi:uncharacterized protein
MDNRIVAGAVIAAGIALAGCQAPTVAGGNPFDECSYARSPDAVVVCSDPQLLELDRRFMIGLSNQVRSEKLDDDDGAFGRRFGGIAPITSGQIGARRQAFLQRRATCGANRACIRALYDRELRRLDWRYGLLPY